MKNKRYGRMTPQHELEIVAELMRWQSGDLGSNFKWDVIVNQFGFSKPTLSSKPSIKEA